MYSNKLAIAIKVDGVILKEVGDNTYLNFGSEYSILIKNLNTKRAIVKITIDGTPVSSGGFVVNANSSIDIERFVKNNESGNRFKFIEMTDTIEQNRGHGIEDGLVRVEFQFEKDMPVLTWGDASHDDYYSHTSTGDWDGGNVVGKGILRGAGSDKKGGARRITASGTGYSPMYSCTTTTTTFKTPEAVTTSDSGITVPGSVSDQKFTQVSSFPLEDATHVMVLNIRGVTEANRPVKVATPSRQKPKCVTCGRVNKAIAKFCTECGTSLIIV